MRRAGVSHTPHAILSRQVAVVVGAAHRHQALDACTYVIDELKRRAPIWKVEG
jgi:molybdopterin synthase catalytic subunit